jgi:hypothetical protein
MVYDFDVFPYEKEEDAGSIAAWLRDKCSDFPKPVEVEVTIRTKKKKGRDTKETAERLLKSLLEWGPSVWEDGPYRFDFSASVFKWGKDELYFTAGETLFLYRALVQQKVCTQEDYNIRHLRHRIDKDFLRGLV